MNGNYKGSKGDYLLCLTKNYKTQKLSNQLYLKL